MGNKSSSWTIILHSYRAQAILFCCAAIYGMLWSAEAIVSIAMICMAFIAVFEVKYPSNIQPKLQFTIRQNFKESLHNFWKEKVWVWITIPFLLVLFTTFYSTDFEYILERLRIKLPFILLPFVFFSIPKFQKRDIQIILFFFLSASFISSFGVLVNYIQNFDEINNIISKGQAIPTPSNHIRFSLVVALSIFCGAALFVNNFYLRWKNEKWIIGGMTAFLFVFLHILSVRSGIISFYLAVLVFIFQYIRQSRRYFSGIVLALLLISIPYVAMQTVPSFQKKISYMKHDFVQYQKGNGKGYSDSERITSLKTGLEIFNKNPIWGVGAGDLKKEIFSRYQNKTENSIAPRMPHNQLISIAAGTGIIGLLLFLISFFYPLFHKKNYRNYLFTALHIIFFTSFFMENTFENNYGLSLFLFSLLIGMNFLNKKE